MARITLEQIKKKQEKNARPNYITREGLKKLQAEYQELLYGERPKLVKTIEWAAANGDRSENADYIYGKKRLREIDGRLEFLGKRMDKAIVVDPTEQKGNKVFFGATVTIEDDQGKTQVFQIVGEDEIEKQSKKITWVSPLGKALIGKSLDDEVTVKTPKGEKIYTIVAVKYV